MRSSRLAAGSYLPAKLLFPYAMLMTAVVHEIGAVGMLLAVAQFPVYGAAIVRADAKGVARPVLISVCAVHGLMVVVALALADPAFTP